MELAPGQMAAFNTESFSFSSSPFDVEYVTGWKDDQLMFRDATFDEVIDKLHLWYGINISVNNKAASGDWSYTANFKSEDLKSVLRNMRTLRNFDYVIKSDSLIISF
jgi:transmembrane sensor